MKRFLYLMVLSVICVFIISGCARVNYTFEIKNNGKVDISVLMAVGANVMSQYSEEGVDSSDIISEEKREEFKRDGWECEPYSEDGFTGYRLIKTDVDISELSDTVERELLSGEGNVQSEMSAQADSLNIIQDGNMYILDWNMKSDEQSGYKLSDYRSYFESMGGYATIVIRLPEKPLESNATEVSDDGKTLTWNILNPGTDSIYLKYDAGDSVLIVVIVIVVIIFIGLLILMLAIKRKKRNVSETGDTDIN